MSEPIADYIVALEEKIEYLQKELEIRREIPPYYFQQHDAVCVGCGKVQLYNDVNMHEKNDCPVNILEVFESILQ